VTVVRSEKSENTRIHKGGKENMGTKKRTRAVVTGLMLIGMVVVLLSAMPALADPGDITDSVLDTYQYHADKGDHPSIVRVSDDVIAVAYKGTDDDGWLATFEIGITPGATYGDITAKDTLEFDTDKGDQASMTHVSGDIYAIAYKKSGELVTVEIDSDGNITDPVLDTYQYHADKGDNPSIVRVSDDVIAVAYKGTDDDGWLATFEIDLTPGATYGDITAKDTLEFDGDKGDQPSMVQVCSSDYYAIAYKGPDDDGWLVTVDIDTDGNIGTVKDTLEFDAVKGEQASMTHVSGDIYAIAYKKSGELVTVQIEAPGTIVIKKVTDPAGGTGFDFTDTITTPNNFTLDHGDAEIFTSVISGTYTVTETAQAGFTLTDLTCDDPDDGSSVSLATGVATIDLDPCETVTCTFTNTAQASITVIKEVVGETPDSDWQFTGDLGGFSISKSGGQKDFTDKDAGDYTITETTKSGYDVEVTCNTGESGTDSVTVDLDPGVAITCTFTNTGAPKMTIDKDVVTDPPVVEPCGQVQYQIMLVNNNTATATGAVIWDILPAGFTYASTDDISYTGGASRSSDEDDFSDLSNPYWGKFTIPSGGSVTITFTADVGCDVGPGTYDNWGCAEGDNFDEICDDPGVSQGPEDPVDDDDITVQQFPHPPGPVGGIVVPVSRLELLAPWLGLAVLAGLAALGVVVVRRRRQV
jgi:uncharacterized repeat protein (TIGR01451 family)